MNIETASKIESLLRELRKLEEIKEITETERSHWWGFLTPDVKRKDAGGVPMTGILRGKFVLAVDESIQEIKKEIEEL